MKNIKELLEAVAAISWPFIVILLILLFRSELSLFLKSARTRKFSIKIGNQELTMEEANKQQQTIITDLQAQVVEIKKRIGAAVLPVPPELPPPTALAPIRSVLWIDDSPKNNSYSAQQLTDKGVNVDLALSTSDGLRLFGGKAYGAVISDMGRTEDGKYKPTAGLELLRQIRGSNKTIPFIISTTSRGVSEHREEAIRLGATAITSSPTEVFGILQTVFKDIRA